MQAFHTKVKPVRTWIMHLRQGLRRRAAVTVAAVANEQGDVYIALAPCSTKDHFVRKIGREMALGRAKKLVSAGAPPAAHVDLDNMHCFEQVKVAAFGLLRQEGLL